MKVSVTPHCNHRDVPGAPDPSYIGSGLTVTGQHAVISRNGVYIDGQPIILRDRRAKRNRSVGHPWVSSTGYPDKRIDGIGWTGFSISVEP